MIISHNLNGNGYLTNNEIWIDISSDMTVVYYKLFLTNMQNGKVSSQFVSYADPLNSASVNIQSIVKSLLDVPNGETNNSTKIQISITANDGTNIFFTKDFVRGGKRVNDTNQTISPNQTLRLTEKLPTWSGFPIFDYFLDSDYLIQKKNLAEVSNVDYKKIKGCNNIYIKFLNQKGGYSYWLFESFSEKESNRNLGYVVSQNRSMVDLGNESKSELNIYSKIPKEYKDYARDVIISPDIYAYQNGGWKKVFSANNSIEWDSVKKVYSVNLNISLNYRFNPTLIW